MPKKNLRIRGTMSSTVPCQLSTRAVCMSNKVGRKATNIQSKLQRHLSYCRYDLISLSVMHQMAKNLRIRGTMSSILPC